MIEDELYAMLKDLYHTAHYARWTITSSREKRYLDRIELMKIEQFALQARRDMRNAGYVSAEGEDNDDYSTGS